VQQFSENAYLNSYLAISYFIYNTWW